MQNRIFFLFICWTKVLSLWTDRIHFQKNLPLCDKFKDEIKLIKIDKSGNYVFATDPVRGCLGEEAAVLQVKMNAHQNTKEHIKGKI